jgi:hypothetical protein
MRSYGSIFDFHCEPAKPKEREVLTLDTLMNFKAHKQLADGGYTASFQPERDRILRLRVHDYLFSIGAVHYYATVTLPYLSWSPDNDPRCQRICRDLPSTATCVEMTTPLTQKEISRVAKSLTF